MSFCTKCGGATDPNASFCRACGTAVPPPSAGVVSGAAAPAVAVKKSRKGLKIAGIVAAAFFGLLIIVAIVSPSKKTASEATGVPESKPATGQPAAEEPAKRQQASQASGEPSVMCAEITKRLTDFFENHLKGIECQPAAGKGDSINLVIAYPAPFLSKGGTATKNALYVAFMFAGEAISKHSGVKVSEVHALDSTQTIFKVSGEFAEQVYVKSVANQLSSDDGRELVLRNAQRVEFPGKSR
jgi:hypothetical protein